MDGTSDEGSLKATRRGMLIGSGLGMMAAAHPGIASTTAAPANKTPPGHDWRSPAFRPINLQK